MIWLGIFIGIAVGWAASYLYYHSSDIYKLGSNLLSRAKGDVEKAWNHIGRL